MNSDFFLPAWDELPSGRRQELAASVCTALPQFRFESVELRTQDSHAHHVAFYSFGGSKFALIPAPKRRLATTRITRGCRLNRSWITGSIFGR